MPCPLETENCSFFRMFIAMIRPSFLAGQVRMCVTRLFDFVPGPKSSETHNRHLSDFKVPARSRRLHHRSTPRPSVTRPLSSQAPVHEPQSAPLARCGPMRRPGCVDDWRASFERPARHFSSAERGCSRGRPNVLGQCSPVGNAQRCVPMSRRLQLAAKAAHSSLVGFFRPSSP